MGFVSILPGALGLWKALLGLLLGVALTLPMYVLHAMGAGDVKLMAMLGAFLGPRSLFFSALLIFMVGGLLSVVTALRYKTLGLMFNNVRNMLWGSYFKAALRTMPVVDAAPVSAGKMPYGVAIALGTYLYIALFSLGYLDFLRYLFLTK
jgi:prepilin peptidase CpaA